MCGCGYVRMHTDNDEHVVDPDSKENKDCHEAYHVVPDPNVPTDPEPHQ